MPDRPAEVRNRPCPTCPYRQDVLSGVWDRAEYEKLRAYDNPVALQPQAPFFCHQMTGHVCAGWAGCGSGHGQLALRIGMARGTIAPSAAAYESPVPLFASGAEAADHGERDIEDPGTEAREAVAKLTRIRNRRN